MVCVDGLMKNGVCLRFCSKQCSACVNDPNNCALCGQYYTLSPDNKCTKTYKDTRLIDTAFSIISNLRVTHLKFVFLLVDDYELYEYHQC